MDRTHIKDGGVNANLKPIPKRTRTRQELVHKLMFLLTNHSFRGIGLVKRIVSKLLLPKPEGLTICPTVYGFDLIVNPVIDKGIERTIYYEGSYEAGTILVMEKCLRMDDIFIDVGSNIGLMSLAASKFVGRNGKVWSFEPEPEIFSILQQNIEINKASNIGAMSIALGSEKGKALIYNNLEINRASASLLKPPEDVQGKEVLIETLDEVVDKIINIEYKKPIRMLKIDVEGWELEVVKGAKRLLSSPRAPILCIEYSNLHATYKGQLLDIYNFLKTVNNYHILKLKKSKERPSKLVRIENPAELPFHDNIFCFLPSHLEGLPKNMFDRINT